MKCFTFTHILIYIIRTTRVKILSDESDLNDLPSPELEGKHCHHPDDQSVAPLGQLSVGLLGGLPGVLLVGLLGGPLGGLLGGLLVGLLGDFLLPNVRVPQTADSPSP